MWSEGEPCLFGWRPALPEILAGIRVGIIRGVKGVVIGHLLVSIIGYGELFELYSRNFLMAHFWALAILLFAFALLASEAVAALERRVEYYAASRSRRAPPQNGMSSSRSS